MSDCNRAATRREIVDAVQEALNGVCISIESEDGSDENVELLFSAHEAESLVHQLDIQGYEIRRKV